MYFVGKLLSRSALTSASEASTSAYFVTTYLAIYGENLVLELHSLEAIKRIKESLNPQGIYITNIIGSLSGKYSQNIKNVIKTLKQCFKYIYVFKAQEKNEHQKRQNLIVVAVDQEVHFNIVSYHNINQKRYHQGMIDHVDDIDYTNGRILRDKNLL